MDIKVWPGKLSGVVKAPPSKSMAHRALICGALAEGVSVIRGISGSKDMEATMGCMTALGAEITRLENGSDVEIRGIGKKRGDGDGDDYQPLCRQLHHHSHPAILHLARKKDCDHGKQERAKVGHQHRRGDLQSLRRPAEEKIIPLPATRPGGALPPGP